MKGALISLISTVNFKDLLDWYVNYQHSVWNALDHTAIEAASSLSDLPSHVIYTHFALGSSYKTGGNRLGSSISSQCAMPWK